ncbi:MAG: DNA polymerase IV [Clostridia bacterium]|nr:DNA polymerase IV [Clostridia bacterium]
MEKQNVILHSDLNNFFASVEMALNPSLVGKPVAVCGNAEERHGIVLAKSEIAKKMGVKTAMTIIEAKRLCPNLVTVQSHHDLYEEYSKKVRKIYERYTDRIEPFGIDEAWLDVTHSSIFGSGKEIADKIRKEVKEELGLTCSVGVSFNKVFAKLASDLKKPDATTVINCENYIKTVWRLPVSDLLFVGKSTSLKLNRYNIFTIGDLANTTPEFLNSKLGKWGETLWMYANGKDDSPVRRIDEEERAKSVGNSVTTYRDLQNLRDVKMVLTYLCESVAERLVSYGIGKATTLSISVRDSSLSWVTRQCKLPYPSTLSEDFFKSAVALFEANYKWHSSIRSIGVSVSDFIENVEQLTFEQDTAKYEKKVELEKRVTNLRKKYGDNTIRKGITLCDTEFGRSVHPHDNGITKVHNSTESDENA